MITITMPGGEKKNFNLKNQEREKSLYSAWYSMQGDEKYKDKAIKVTTDMNEELHLNIQKITVVYDESIYVVGEVRNIEERQKKKREESKPKSLMDKINQMSKAREKANVKMFFEELKKKNCQVNIRDPFFMDVIEKVKKTTDGALNGALKIKMFANIYAGSVMGRK